ncbi:hypothetical protein [Micromonospora fluostatini]|uniref:hypothetical protein n=1 Tax=Micromonospora sp. JCM 30529 TaxID=3421643 RepID=UPI003D17594A
MSYPPPGPPSPGQPPQHPYGNQQPGHPPQYGTPQPGYPGQPGRPQPGYGAPPPSAYPPPPATPVTKRIPEDQPFVVRPSVAKRGGIMGGVMLALLTPIVCCAGLGITQGSDGSPVLPVLGMLGCLLLLVGLPLGFQLWLIASGGPILALSPAGVWIRSRPTRGQAVWLPWEAVARISRRRWSLEKMLVVQPHDPRMVQNLGVFTALDSGLLSAFYGSGLVATLNFADKPEAEIMAAVAHYSAGRCPIT